MRRVTGRADRGPPQPEAAPFRGWADGRPAGSVYTVVMIGMVPFSVSPFSPRGAKAEARVADA